MGFQAGVARRWAWGLAAALVVVVHAPAAPANAPGSGDADRQRRIAEQASAEAGGGGEACVQAYDLVAIGVRDYRDRVLASAADQLKRHTLPQDIAEAMDKSDSADAAVRLTLQQADDQEARADAALRSANAAGGAAVRVSDLDRLPLTSACSGARGTSICSAVAAHWEALRMRQLAAATPCYWGEPAATPPAPAQTAHEPPPAPKAQTVSVTPPPPLRPPTPTPAAGDDPAALNNSVIEASHAIDRRNEAQTDAYRAARTEYEAELARQKAEAADAQRKHAEDMAAWKQQVEACKAGDYKACAK
jgi:hypothetical protein